MYTENIIMDYLFEIKMTNLIKRVYLPFGGFSGNCGGNLHWQEYTQLN